VCVYVCVCVCVCLCVRYISKINKYTHTCTYTHAQHTHTHATHIHIYTHTHLRNQIQTFLSVIVENRKTAACQFRGTMPGKDVGGLSQHDVVDTGYEYFACVRVRVCLSGCGVYVCV